tara:strand:+ start:2826 stop:3764 length:939 start_codon:yes stop_codon:yes gene_type:complete
MPFQHPLILVTIEDYNTRIPKVLEDYIYSLNIFDSVVRLSDLKLGDFKESSSTYICTQMWLHVNELEKDIINEMLSNDRFIFLNVEMLSEETRMKHIVDLIQNGVQVADYSEANILFLNEYLKYNNIPLTKDIIYLPYQYNLKDQVQLENIDDKFEYDIGIINALPEQSDTVNSSNTYRRTKMWNDLQKTKWKCLNILGWGAERDNLIKRCKVIINIHHFECFNIFEHIRCDRLIFAKKIIVSDNSLYMDKLDITRYIFSEEFDNIIPKVSNILENFEKYYRDSMKKIPMSGLIKYRRDILENELKKISSYF